MSRDAWEDEATSILRSQLVLRGISYERLAYRFDAIGLPANAEHLKTKISRGKFNFVFWLQCMCALGLTKVEVPLPDWETIHARRRVRKRKRPPAVK